MQLGSQTPRGRQTPQTHGSWGGRACREVLGWQVGSWGRGGGAEGLRDGRASCPCCRSGMRRRACWLVSGWLHRASRGAPVLPSAPPYPWCYAHKAIVLRHHQGEAPSEGRAGAGKRKVVTDTAVPWGSGWLPSPCHLLSCRPVEWKSHGVRGQIINQDTALANRL